MGANHTKIVPANSSNTLQTLLSSQQIPQQTLSVLLAKLTSKIKFQKQHNIVSLGFQQMPQIQLTQTIVELFWSENFQEKTLYWYRYLKQFINGLLAKKSMMFVTAEEWRLGLGLAEFVMLACDQNIRAFLNSVNQINLVIDQQQQNQQPNKTKTYKQSRTLSPPQQSFTEQQKKQIRDKFRQFIYYSIYAKNKLVPNVSSISFTQIYRTLQCVLNLYVKLEINNPDNGGFKRNIILCTYVIGIGVEYEHCLLIDLAARLAVQVVKKGLEVPEILIEHQSLPPIPAQYFKQIPKLSCKCLYETLATYILYAVLVKINQIDLQQICILFELIVSVHRPQNKEIMIFITEISKSLQFSQKNSNILRKTIKKYVNRSRQGKGTVDVSIRKFLDKENQNSCEIRSIGSDSYMTQAYKTKSFGNFPIQNHSKQLQAVSLSHHNSNIKQINNLYHKMVIKRFLPSIYQNFVIDSQIQPALKFPRVFRQMVQMQQKVSKKNSEQQSLQQMNQQQKSQKYGKGFKIQQMQ